MILDFQTSELEENQFVFKQQKQKKELIKNKSETISLIPIEKKRRERKEKEKLKIKKFQKRKSCLLVPGADGCAGLDMRPAALAWSVLLPSK